MKRKIWLGILILIVAGGAIAYRMFSKEEPDITQDKPDAAITVKGLIEAFEKDTASASKMYIDKIVEVTGIIKSVDTAGAVVMGEVGSASEVVVGLDRRHLKEAAELKPGTNATLQGICSGYTTSSGDPDDMLASLGATVQLRSGGIKNKK